MTPAWVDQLPAALVLVPLALAALTWLLPASWRPAAGLAGHVVFLALSALVAWAVAAHGELEQALGGWAPPLGILTRADGVTAVLALLVGVVTLAVAWHAAATRVAGPSTWPLLGLLQAGLAAVAVAGDLFNAYVGLEIVGLAAVGLVALGGGTALRAALRYLLVAVLGSLFFLVAVGVVYGVTGVLDMRLAGAAWAAADAPAALPLGLAAVGLALKCALFPLHGWLPDAHAAAPSAASPLLSALVVKAPFVLLVRLWFEVTGPDQLVGLVLGGLGAAAVLWGGLQAMTQTHLKRMVAYSTVAQVGYLFLLFPLTLPGTAVGVQRTALAAVLLLAVSHGLAKSTLFLVASTVKAKRGTDELAALPGLGAAWPPMLLALAVAAVSLIGLPISAGFAGKWQLLTAAADRSSWWILAVVIAGSLTSATYLLRPVAGSLRRAASGGDDPGGDGAADADGDADGDGADDADGDSRAHWPALPWSQAVAPLLLATLTGLLGLNSVWLVTLAAVGWEGIA